jgi:hypothetical protein
LLRLASGWQASPGPYLAVAPTVLKPMDARVPALGPGESVALPVHLPAPVSSARQVAWITLLTANGTLAASGSPPLQLATAGP